MDEYVEIGEPSLLPVKPVVSVLMITYNHEPYIEQAIEAIVAQKTSFPIELIIGEDCSGDATRAKALDAQKRYPHLVRVVHGAKNIGANRNFQRVLSLCRGEYVAVCEGDDYWRDSEKLQKQVNLLASDPNLVLTFHDACVVNESGAEVGASVFREQTRNFNANELVMGAYVPMFAMCFRNVIRELPDEFFKVVNGDSFLTSLLGNFGNAAFQADIRPSAYRLHGGGIWSGLHDEEKSIKSVATYFWLAMYYKRLGKHRVSKKYAVAAMGLLNAATANPGYFPILWTAARFFPSRYKAYRRLKNRVVDWLRPASRSAV